MINFFKNIKLVRSFEFIFTSIVLYLSFNLLKFKYTGLFIVDGTESEFYKIMVSASIPVILLVILSIYLLIRKHYIKKYPEIKVIHTKEPKALEVTVYTMISICIVMLFLFRDAGNELLFDLFFVKRLVIDWRFYVSDLIVIFGLVMFKKFPVLMVVKNIIYTKVFFIWFLYIVNISIINVQSDIFGDISLACTENTRKVSNILIIQKNVCDESLKHVSDVTEQTTLIQLLKSLNDKTINQKNKAAILDKYYKINSSYSKKSWLELEKPEIYKNAYMLQFLNRTMDNIHIEREIIQSINADDFEKMNELKKRYGKISLAAKII